MKRAHSVILTEKQLGGGRSFMRSTAAGGTGKTPPGTGCSPGATKKEKIRALKKKTLICLNGQQIKVDFVEGHDQKAIPPGP